MEGERYPGIEGKVAYGKGGGAPGTPSLQAAGTNGAGSLVTERWSSSNVDLASQFSQLIIAQNAYSANAKVVTTANQLLQATLQMIT